MSTTYQPQPATGGHGDPRVLISLDELCRLLAERDRAKSEAACHAHNHDAALDQRDAALADAQKLADAIRWALGEGDSDFGEGPNVRGGRYWWRSELRKRAGDALNVHGAVPRLGESLTDAQIRTLREVVAELARRQEGGGA